MRILFLVLVVLCCTSVFSINTTVTHVTYFTSSFITLKDKDVVMLSSNVSHNTISYTLYVRLKEKDVPSLNSSIVHQIISSSSFINILPNKEFVPILYLDIANKTYRDLLLSLSKNIIVNDSSFASTRVIINNESTSFFGFDSINVLHYGSDTFLKPFSCLVVSKNNTVYIYGNSVVGVVNGISLFLSNEDRFVNSDYVLYYDDTSLEGLKRWDLYKSGYDIFSSFYSESFYNISTVYNLSHRVKHLISLLSSKYSNGVGATDTIVFSAGLWGDINGWDTLALRLVSSGYDVWELELTGGNGTECSSCYNYDFSYLTDYAFPLLIGFVSNHTSKNITYVGHSNGGRVAISSLDRWGSSGRVFNDTSLFDMKARPIHHLVGVGVPGAFEGQNNLFSFMLSQYGGNIKNYNMTHITLDEAASIAFLNKSYGDINNKISQNLFYDYHLFAENNSDLQPGYSTTLDKFDIIYSGIGIPTTSIILYSNDEIVDIVDEELIYANINSTDKDRHLLMNKIHTDMPSDKEIQELIEKRLLKDE